MNGWRIWPWSAIDRLTVDLRGARLACSAEAKKANRLAARIAKLEGVLVRLRAQARHDQAYIDALESRLERASIDAARRTIPRPVVERVSAYTETRT